jgi:GST-like protein
MIDLYTSRSPNGDKVRIMLEECELDFSVRAIDLARDEHHDPEFLAISPNGKIPAIVDHDGPDGEPISIFESGAILLYLADRTGRLMPTEPRRRWQVVAWLMVQMSGIGPTFGQLGHFLYSAPEPSPAAVDRFSSEVQRLASVVDRRLRGRDFLVDDYSIADIACFPFIARHERLGIDLDELPALGRWLGAIAARPAVRRAMSPIDAAG